MIFHNGAFASVEVGDCREGLARLALQGVRFRTCVTSPPYYGLRDYGHDGQIGLEQTPDEYIAAMVEVFRGVRDVLTDDGTLWVNIGDSYARTGGTDRKVSDSAKVGSTRNTLEQMSDRTSNAAAQGCKPKDLIGIPWMLAFALRADGWFLRQDIIWNKPNPMPESVRDRCTKAHEYVFLLSKSEKYYFDSEAMREPADPKNYRSGATARETPPGQNRQGKLDARRAEVLCETRNKRSVWTVTPKPYRGAHFAVYPPELIEPCVLAGSAPGDWVLDPFGGSGTTAGVALRNGRNAVLCELNAEYAALVPDRVGALCRV